MKLITTAALTFFLLASASAQTNRTGAISSLGVAQAPGSQSITILRRGAQPSRQVMAGNFTGSVRVDPLFQANAPARASGSLVTFEPGARMHLPEIGVRGNTHFPFSDLNNIQIADALSTFLSAKKLD